MPSNAPAGTHNNVKSLGSGHYAAGKVAEEGYGGREIEYMCLAGVEGAYNLKFCSVKGSLYSFF